MDSIFNFFKIKKIGKKWEKIQNVMSSMNVARENNESTNQKRLQRKLNISVRHSVGRSNKPTVCFFFVFL